MPQVPELKIPSKKGFMGDFRVKPGTPTTKRRSPTTKRAYSRQAKQQRRQAIVDALREHGERPISLEELASKTGFLSNFGLSPYLKDLVKQGRIIIVRRTYTRGKAGQGGTIYRVLEPVQNIRKIEPTYKKPEPVDQNPQSPGAKSTTLAPEPPARARLGFQRDKTENDLIGKTVVLLRNGLEISPTMGRVEQLSSDGLSAIVEFMLTKFPEHEKEFFEHQFTQRWVAEHSKEAN